jgi:hypothetical protein
VRETGANDAPAFYHQKWLASVEWLETQTLIEGTLLSDSGIKRYYWAEFGEVIGASRGEETKFILVEHHVGGHFHGHPVTWEELRDEGADYENQEFD